MSWFQMVENLAPTDRSLRLPAGQLLTPGLALCSAASASLLLTTYLLGRANPLQATWMWLALLAAAFLVLSWYLLRSTFGLFALPAEAGSAAYRPFLLLLLTTLAATVAANGCFYLSDGLNHAFANRWELRSLVALIIAAALFVALEVQESVVAGARYGIPSWQALGSRLGGRAEIMVPAALVLVGLLLGTSYITVMGDDYARYWTVADSLAQGLGYPASEVAGEYRAGGMSTYLVDLPALPLAMVAAFSLMGHNVLAAMAPALLAATLFPLVTYLALRELTRDATLGFVGSVGLATFPLLLFYVLRATEPDGMFVTAAMAMAFVAIRLDGRRNERWMWLALGPIAALVALTRPEGIVYTVVLFLTLAIGHRASGGYWVAISTCAVILALFSAAMLATFGTPWPTSFAGAVAIDHVARNLDGFVVHGLPRYSAALGLPQPVLVLSALAMAGAYLIGCVRLAASRPQLLFLALLPILGAAIFLLASPALTRPHLPYDYFRRASYGVPYLVLVALYGITPLLERCRRSGALRGARRLLLVAAIVLVVYHVKLMSTPEETYGGNTQLLTSGSYLLATDLIAHPYGLPWLPFERDGRVLVVSDAFDYMTFRGDLNRFFAPMDLHSSTRAAGYAPTALAIFLAGLCYAAVGKREQRGEGLCPCDG